MFNFLALLDIRVFGHLIITIAASDWPHTIFTARLFLFRISLLFVSIHKHIRSYKQVLTDRVSKFLKERSK